MLNKFFATKIDAVGLGLLIIRVGLSGVLLWFGSQQLLSPQDWVGYIPSEVLTLTPVGAQTWVLLNGSAEIALGTLIFLGVFVHFAALVMGLHLALIAYSLGYTAVGVRDWGLAFALLGLALTGGGMLSAQQKTSRQ
ncbi:MAG: DoxX family membrane protein [Candidatus Pacebacteria bacterium]|nr:DoxX family membrane protein [Candidatus Paceibacterota bacterium]